MSATQIYILPCSPETQQTPTTHHVCVCGPQRSHLLQCSGLVSCDEPAHDDVLKQDHLEGGQDGAAVEHWGQEGSEQLG